MQRLWLNNGLESVSDIEKLAIERLQTASDMSLRMYDQPLVITYSGGKDSDVILHLAKASGIPFEVLHSHTTADAPQTVRHVRETFQKLEENGIKCTIDYHRKPDGKCITMWNLIPKKLIPPTRLIRYCCEVLKEGDGKGRFIATGVRWDESTKRKQRGKLEVMTRNNKNRITLNNDNEEDRRLFENCQLKGKRVVNPIIDWGTADILAYIETEKIPMNPLYGCGFSRVGCIGCPMAGRKGREFEFEMFPKYKAAYIRAFDKMVAERKRRGLPCELDSIDVFHWWMEHDVLPGQEVMEGFEDI